MQALADHRRIGAIARGESFVPPSVHVYAETGTPGWGTMRM
jgi:hypothetical protein